MEYKKLSYRKILVFFIVFIIFTLISGCGGTISEPFGTIDINSTPSGTRVYLDGVDTGQATPTIFNNVGVGEHTVRLSLFHYKDWEGIITVVAEQTTYLNALLIWSPVDTITIQPGGTDGKDAEVDNLNPTVNYGYSIYLDAGTDNNDILRSYLQFDLSSVPPDAVILDANLGLYFKGIYIIPYLPTQLGLYEVTESWEENTITWDNQPASSTEAEDMQNITDSLKKDFVYWDIDDLVKGWYDGSITNYGMVLRDTDESSADDRIDFCSSGDITASRHPKLIIDYYLP